MNWDEWRGQENAPSMLIKRILWIPLLRRDGKWNGIRVDLHKMVDIDAPDCFHTHPAYAVRVPLSGGYWEEVISECGSIRAYIQWQPGQIGLVRPKFCHRIAGLPNAGVSYSLWIRGPVTNEVELRGEGWAKQ